MFKKILKAIGIILVCMVLMGEVWGQEYIPFKKMKSYGEPESGWVKWYTRGSTTYTSGARDSIIIANTTSNDTCYSSIYENAGNVTVQLKANDKSASNDSVSFSVEILGAIQVPGVKAADSEFKRVYAGYLKKDIVSTSADTITTEGWNCPFKLYLEDYNLFRFMAYPRDDCDQDDNLSLKMKITRVNY